MNDKKNTEDSNNKITPPPLRGVVENVPHEQVEAFGVDFLEDISKRRIAASDRICNNNQNLTNLSKEKEMAMLEAVTKCGEILAEAGACGLLLNVAFRDATDGESDISGSSITAGSRGIILHMLAQETKKAMF